MKAKRKKSLEKWRRLNRPQTPEQEKAIRDALQRKSKS